ncbi:MFS transporter [Actinomycetes bacterium M1A6_2h]
MTLLAMTPVQEMERPYAKRWAALGVLCLSLLVVVMANTSLLVAAPAMTMDLQLSSADLQWVIDGYTVPYAALMLLFGVVGDRYSRRGALLLGLATFTAGSIAGALTDATAGVIAARVVMGVAAAIVMPATLSLLVATFPKKERATAVTVWAATSGLAIAAGPLLAGWLLESYWWGSSFLINVPITVFAIVAAIALVPPSRATDLRPIDWLGGVLSVIGVASVVYAIIEGMHSGWADGPRLFAVVGAAGIAAFVAWELWHPNPLLDVRAFGSRVLGGATLAVLLFFLVTFGAIYYVAQYLQFVLGYGPVATGVHLLPLAGAVFVGSAVTQWLTPKLGMKHTVTAGMFAGTAAVASMLRIDSGATFVDFLPALVLLGLGIGLAVSPCTDAIMGEFPDNKLGVAGGLNDTALELGGSFGIAVLGSVLATSYHGGIAAFLTAFPGKGADGQPTAQAAQAIEASGDSVAGAVIVSDIMRRNSFLAGYANTLEANAIDAFNRAVVHTSTIAAVVFGVGAVVVWLLLPGRKRFSDGAAREVAELEHLLEQPSAARATAAVLHTSSVTDSSVEARPNIYQLAAKVSKLQAAMAEEEALSDTGQLNLLRLALGDVARNRRKAAEDELHAVQFLAERPLLRPAPWPVPIPAQQNIYQFGSHGDRAPAEADERSSSVWAMPL